MPYVPGPVQRRRAASAPVLWSPGDHSPLFWHDVPLSFAAPRLYQDTGKTSAVTTLGQSCLTAVQDGGLTPDLVQATGSNAPVLAQIGGAYALSYDGAADRLSSAQTFSAGAKTVGLLFQYSTVLGASELDVPLSLGASPTQFRLAMGGPSSTFPGIQWVCDVGAGSTAFRRVVWTPDTAQHTLLVCYDGSSHRAWLDGVEQSVVAGSSSVASGTTSLGAISVGSAAAAVKIGRTFLCPSNLSADATAIQSYLIGGV